MINDCRFNNYKAPRDLDFEEADYEPASQQPFQSGRRLMLRIRNFLLFCSGATIPILLQAGSQDVDQYVRIGTVILFTAIVASLSGGYAFYTIFKGAKLISYLSVIFGVFWGSFILTIDRLMVSTIKKSQANPRTIMIQILPRLVMAFAIGFIVSKPIELILFQREIMVGSITERIQAFEEDLKNKTVPDIKAQEKIRKEAVEKEAELRSEWRVAASAPFKKLAEEAQGRINALEGQRTTKQTEIDTLRKNKANLEKGLINDEKTERITQEYENLGFFTQYNLMKKNHELFWVGWFVTSFFILIELLPVLAKLLSSKGSYDVMLEDDRLAKTHESEIERQVRIDKSNVEREIQSEKHRSEGENIDQLIVFLHSEVGKILKEVEETNEYRDATDRAKKRIIEQVERKLLDYSQHLSDDVSRSAAVVIGQATTDQLRSRFNNLEKQTFELNARVGGFDEKVDGIRLLLRQIENDLSRIKSNLINQYPGNGSTASLDIRSDNLLENGSTASSEIKSNNAIDNGSTISSDVEFDNTVMDFDRSPTSNDRDELEPKQQDGSDRFGSSSSRQTHGTGSTSDSE